MHESTFDIHLVELQVHSIEDVHNCSTVAEQKTVPRWLPKRIKVYRLWGLTTDADLESGGVPVNEFDIAGVPKRSKGRNSLLVGNIPSI